jgi:acyl-CoA synthetase (AMP-forming)/AMP-acid ligase II
MIRYFKQEELTKETITEDGWYKTGDIGQWESDGTLSIIDRIKNLVSPLICDCIKLMIGQIAKWRVHRS